MTASDVLTQIRRMLNDSAAGNYRWPNSTLLTYLTDVQIAVRQYRPDLFLSSAGTITEPSTGLSLNDTLSLDESYRTMFVDLVCARALKEEADDAENMRRSNEHLQSGFERLGVKF